MIGLLDLWVATELVGGDCGRVRVHRVVGVRVALGALQSLRPSFNASLNEKKKIGNYLLEQKLLTSDLSLSLENHTNPKRWMHLRLRK